MPLADRDYMRGSHPPACTCWECTKRRLRRLRKEAHPSYVSFCPKCRKRSLWHNVREHKYECLNLNCRAILYETALKTFAAPGSVGVRKRKGLPRSLVPILVVVSLLILGFGFYSLYNGHGSSTTTQVAPPQTVITPSPPQTKPIQPPSSTPVMPVIPIQPTLRNPSWEELKAFLWEDKTDQLEYVFPTFVCHDFAKSLQASAKEAGWRCAFVSVRLEGYPDWFNYGIPSNTGHSLNAFETTDKGLVYIDCTSTPGGFSGNADTIVNVEIGKEYIPRSIFSTPGYYDDWASMGIVAGIEIVQW